MQQMERNFLPKYYQHPMIVYVAPPKFQQHSIHQIMIHESFLIMKMKKMKKMKEDAGVVVVSSIEEEEEEEEE